MKTPLTTISIIIFLLFFAFAKALTAQTTIPEKTNLQQEIFIIGTMHEVPNIVKHAYKPLLKIAKEYQPDAIYVERQRPNDSLSLINYESSYFIPLSDSIAKTFTDDAIRYKKLQKTSLKNMIKEDFIFLSNHYAVQRDKANYLFYRYLIKYGIAGSRKPLRNENFDLTAPLAITMDINYIYSMDHQHETQAYTKFSGDCVQDSKKDGQIKLLTKHNKRDYRKHILPGLFGNLGIYSNRIETIKRYEVSNRFTFRETPCESCEAAKEIWDRRNKGMAYNIGSQVLENNQTKAIVIVGAGHVLGIKSELEKQFPNIKVRIIDKD